MKLKRKDTKLLFKRKKRIKDTIHLTILNSFGYAPMDDERPCF